MLLDLIIGLLVKPPLTPPEPPPIVQTVAPSKPLAIAMPIADPMPIDTDAVPLCNCYLMVKGYVPSLPHTKDLKPNSPVRAGAVAIYDYDGIPHYALVLTVDHGDVYRHFEIGSNIPHCERYERWVDEENPHLVGYWYPVGNALTTAQG